MARSDCIIVVQCSRAVIRACFLANDHTAIARSRYAGAMRNVKCFTRTCVIALRGVRVMPHKLSPVRLLVTQFVSPGRASSRHVRGLARLTSRVGSRNFRSAPI